jgi:cytochrome c553
VGVVIMTRRKHFALMVLLLAFSNTVWAAPSSQVVWTPETIGLIRSADPEKGKTLSGSCASCHGAEGLSTVAMYPHLAGQRADYTYKQLHDYKDGSRKNMIMNSLVANLSDQDMADLSVYYESLPPPGGQSGLQSSHVSDTVIRIGDGKRLLPSCDSCHSSPGNLRNYGIPLLDGQTQGYLKQTLQDYKTGARANDVYSVMRLISARLTEEEIELCATHYAAEWQ